MCNDMKNDLNTPNKNMITQTERDDFARYLWLKALSLNTLNGMAATGVFGVAIGGILGGASNALSLAFLWSEQKPLDTATEWALIGGLITGVPGAAIGAVTSPLRRLSLYERELRYSNNRIDYFVGILKEALASYNRGDRLSADRLTLPELFQKITSEYETVGGTTSSSEFLRYHLKGETRYVFPPGDPLPGETFKKTCSLGPAEQDIAIRARYLIEYLSAVEIPLSAINSKEYRKNQGKPLFNIIMDILEKDGQKLLPNNRPIPPIQSQGLFSMNRDSSRVGEEDELKRCFGHQK